MHRSWSAATAALIATSLWAHPAAAQAVNRAPIARTDHLTARADTPLVVLYGPLLANDSPGRGERGQRIRVVEVADDPDSPGSVLVTGGHAVFIPPAGFVGTARFSYTIRDNGGTRRGGQNTDTGWVKVTVAH
jgi:hypothetical protein